MPGRPPSDRPAIEGPASTKPRARMKVKVRIMTVSGLGTGADRRYCWRLDNHPLFPDVCAQSGKWFHRAAESFRGPTPRETVVKKSTMIPVGEPARRRVGH